jgi:hypothetical protein
VVHPASPGRGTGTASACLSCIFLS